MNCIMPIIITIFLSIVGFFFIYRIIPRVQHLFLNKNLHGIDLGKQSERKIPEAIGVILGPVFLIIILLPSLIATDVQFPHHEFAELSAVLFYYCCMLFLAYVVDVFNLQWQYKLLVHTIASSPLLKAYYLRLMATYNGTTPVIIPKPFRLLFGNDIWLDECWEAHLLSVLFVISFFFTTFVLLQYNWYPSSVFVGNKFCFFAAMTFAVVGLLGHFSKTMLLFFMPQVITFLFSCLQLYRFVPYQLRLPRSEAMCLICGAILLIIVFRSPTDCDLQFSDHQFIKLYAALSPICLSLYLGFCDDVSDLKWRYKLIIPIIASLPLLLAYYMTYDGTTVIIHDLLRPLLGNAISLGPFYYVWMVMFTIFCTNSINIFAGINGLEAGQALIISASVIIFNTRELFGECGEAHLFSLHFMISFFFITLALLRYNWYPASVFVGDTFCYFAGMTFAVVGILGHFSETMFFFFIPQFINFLFSVPQLLTFLPCPRHRLPRYNRETDLMEPSMYAECMNFTLINWVLKVFGPTHEETLTIYLLIMQVMWSCILLSFRYGSCWYGLCCTGICTGIWIVILKLK